MLCFDVRCKLALVFLPCWKTETYTWAADSASCQGVSGGPALTMNIKFIHESELPTFKC